MRSQQARAIIRTTGTPISDAAYITPILPMSSRIFKCSCQKCGAKFDFTGSYAKFSEFLDSKNFTCPSGHTESRSGRAFVKVVGMSEPEAFVEWKPAEGRNYVDILDPLTARIKGMQIDHLGSGLYIDHRTMKKYDYEEDAKGKRHYFEVPLHQMHLKS